MKKFIVVYRKNGNMTEVPYFRTSRDIWVTWEDSALVHTTFKSAVSTAKKARMQLKSTGVVVEEIG